MNISIIFYRLDVMDICYKHISLRLIKKYYIC